MTTPSANGPSGRVTDVFISYKREERGDVERIAERLRGLGLNVWFDTKLASGMSFDEEINREVRSAKCVLVCWSPGAMASDWVRAEASIGRGRDVLAAVMLKPTELFPPFNLIHAEDLSSWRGEDVHRGWLNTLARIGDLCGRPDISDRARRYVAAGDGPAPRAPASAPPSEAPAKSGGGIGALVMAGVLVLAAVAGGAWWLNRGGGAPAGDQVAQNTPPAVTEPGDAPAPAAPPTIAPPTTGAPAPPTVPPPVAADLPPAATAPMHCARAAQAYKLSAVDARRLCGALSDAPDQGPLQCYTRLMDVGMNWGGGTRWQPANAIRLCAGASRPFERLDCFEQGIRAGQDWNVAIERCTGAAAASPPASPPAADAEPAVLKSGSARLRPSFEFDLDTEREGAPNSDIWYRARTATELALGPARTNNTAVLRMDRQPTRTECRTARFGGAEIDVSNPGGVWLCVRTTEGRMAVVNVAARQEEGTPPIIIIRYTIWER